MMDWNRNPGPIRPVWRARGRTHDWVIVEAGGGTPNLLYSSPRRGSLNRETESGEFGTLEEAKAAAERLEERT